MTGVHTRTVSSVIHQSTIALRIIFLLNICLRTEAARSWFTWEDTVLSLEPGATVHNGPIGEWELAFARIVTHFYSHEGWLEPGAVIRDAGSLRDIPGVLIHGRRDLSCPVDTAWELARAWPGAELLIDDGSGHRGSDVKRAWKLDALARFADRGRG